MLEKVVLSCDPGPSSRPKTQREANKTPREEKRPRRWPGPLSNMPQIEMLLKFSRDAGEGRGQLGADAVHDRDDGDRDAGGDEAIFDGGRAGLVLHKALHEV